MTFSRVFNLFLYTNKAIYFWKWNDTNIIDKHTKSSNKEEKLKNKRIETSNEVKEKLKEMMTEDIEVYTTSAKTGQNIFKLFKDIAEQCHAKLLNTQVSN